MQSWKKICSYAAAFCVAAGAAFGFYYKQAMQEMVETSGVILEYHSISRQDWDPSLVIAPEVFEHHLQVLQKNNYKVVTVAELAKRLRKGESVDHYVAMSFDDGYKDNYTAALPLLVKYNAKATFSVIPGKIGGAIYMDEAEINKMIDAGMEIGSHTCSHNPLAIIDPKYLTWEIGSSQYILEQKFPRIQIRTLAYPNGSYNDEVIKYLQKYEYDQALTGHTGVTDAKIIKERPMELNRVIVIDDGKGPDYFMGLIKRGYRRSLFLKWGIDLGE